MESKQRDGNWKGQRRTRRRRGRSLCIFHLPRVLLSGCSVMRSFQDVAQHRLKEAFFYLEMFDKTARRETYRYEIACGISCADHRCCWVAKDFPLRVGGDEVGEDDHEGQNHFHAESLPRRCQLSVCDGGLKIALIARHWNSERRKRFAVKTNPSSVVARTIAQFNKCSPTT